MNDLTLQFAGPELTGFCKQISILLQSAVPLDEGLKVMAEDMADPAKKELLTSIAEQVRMGLPFHQAVREAGCFPGYMVNMTLLGEKTGLLDVVMEGLAVHYEKEYLFSEAIRRAVSYPAMMILMLLIILFVLFTRVMPIFSSVYEQLGASIPVSAQAAIRFGGVMSGAALTAAFLLALAVIFLWAAGRRGRKIAWADALLKTFKSHSSIAQSAACRRFLSVMSMALTCGVDMTEACQMAETMVDNPRIEGKVKLCGQALSSGQSFYDSVRQAELFTGFELQLIRVACRAGQLEPVMKELAEDYDQKAADSIDRMIARLEPTVVSILAVAVGLVLLAVMLPLAGILSSIG